MGEKPECRSPCRVSPPSSFTCRVLIRGVWRRNPRVPSPGSTGRERERERERKKKISRTNRKELERGLLAENLLADKSASRKRLAERRRRRTLGGEEGRRETRRGILAGDLRE